MTKKELIKTYRTFFEAEGLEFICDKLHPSYGYVTYEGDAYNILINKKQSHGGKRFHMFTWGPEFPIWEGSSYWDDDPDLQGKVESAALRVNKRHDPAKVDAYSMVTYSVEISLSSPWQFKEFFYKAAQDLKAIESDFMAELENLGIMFDPFTTVFDLRKK